MHAMDTLQLAQCDLIFTLPLYVDAEKHEYCDSYECPDKYDLVHGAEDIKCDYSGCTKHKCCEEGKPYSKSDF